MTALGDVSVAIIGCGAVGGFTAVHLARLGVRRLILVDYEVLAADNIFRHVLGARFVGRPKVEGLRTKLIEDHPDLEVVALNLKGDEALRNSSVCDSDVLVLATGDQSTEIELASGWNGTHGVVHAWVEPLGVGGHTLLRRPLRGGCLQCLFELDDEHGPVNLASFAAAGQRFSRTQAGCAGAFTPYGVLDADRSAMEAARLVAVAVADRAGPSLLVSWRGPDEAFVREGFRLSDRGSRTNGGSVTVSEGGRFMRKDCPICRGRADAP